MWMAWRRFRTPLPRCCPWTACAASTWGRPTCASTGPRGRWHREISWRCRWTVGWPRCLGDQNVRHIWLVVTGTMDFWMTFHMLCWEWNFIIPTDEVILFRGIENTNQILYDIYIYIYIICIYIYVCISYLVYTCTLIRAVNLEEGNKVMEFMVSLLKSALN